MRPFPRRLALATAQLTTGELTSRIASADIGRTLDKLALEFDPATSTTAGHARADPPRGR